LLVWRFTSQPVSALLSQSAWLGMQAPIWQPLFTHDAAALAKLQPWKHWPQLFTSFVVLTSQPSAGARLQFAKPVLQAPSWQTPRPVTALGTQLSAALGRSQARLQPPQWLMSLARFVSQPSVALRLQSAWLFWQPMMLQFPPLQKASVFAFMQLSPQPPQLFTSLSSGVSQPFAGFMSQLAK
jgi:hypothetical protein